MTTYYTVSGRFADKTRRSFYLDDNGCIGPGVWLFKSFEEARQIALGWYPPYRNNQRLSEEIVDPRLMITVYNVHPCCSFKYNFKTGEME